MDSQIRTDGLYFLKRNSLFGPLGEDVLAELVSALKQVQMEKGDVVLFDCNISMQTIKIIHAHNGPITKLQSNAEGSLFASCSSKGTVIRVHSLPDASKSFEFRR